MKTLEYTQSGKNVNQLHDELIADATVGPDIKGTWNATDGVWDDPQHKVEYDGTTIYITVPDSVATADVDAVVNAHVPA